MDTLAVERSGSYQGLYHVLHGAISPLNGVGPEQLKLKELFARLSGSQVTELVIATNPTLELQLFRADSVVTALAADLELPLKTFDVQILARFQRASV